MAEGVLMIMGQNMRHVIVAMWVVLLLAAACSDGSPVTSDDTVSGGVTVPEPGPVATTGPVPQADQFEVALADRLEDDGTVPIDVALDLFAAAFGVIPGGDPTALPAPDPHAATLALMAVAGYYDDLDAGQRTAFDTVVTAASDGTPLSAPAGLHSLRQPPPNEYLSMVDTARNAIAARVGRSLGVPITVVAHPGTDHWAIASPRRAGSFVADGVPDECLIELWPENLTPGDYTRSVITHEVYHCFQHTGYTDLADWWDTAPWITEGQAFWVAAEVVGSSQEWIAVGYKNWLCNPDLSLWKRYTGAMGFYATMATDGPGDLWGRLDDMLGRARENAVAAAGLPAVDALRFSATGRMHDAGSFADPWMLTGVGIPEACIETADATPEAPWEWTAEIQAFAGGPPLVVAVSGDVVRADGRGGAGAFEFSDGTLLQWTDTFSGLVCLLDEGCKCPDGRDLGDAFAQAGPTAVAVGGGPGTVAASLIPFTLDEACKLAPDLPRMSLRGDPDVDLVGGACVIDGGDLVLSIGYEPSYDARLQPDPYPYMNALMYVRAVPGTWDTGSFYISPVAGEGFRGGDGGLVVTLADDLLTGTFSYMRGTGTFSCPRLLTPEEALAGP